MLTSEQPLHREHVQNRGLGVDRDLQVGPRGRYLADAVACTNSGGHCGQTLKIPLEVAEKLQKEKQVLLP
jgi:hypothetical protein